MLKITIYSFSYKKGIPLDESGNGGGFVFDCRGMDNPYKYNEFRLFSGLDDEIELFFKNKMDMKSFIDLTKKLIDIPTKNYIERDFSNLMISFGCTGGQHRSVYAAKKIGQYLKEKYLNIEIDIIHRERKNWILTEN